MSARSLVESGGGAAGVLWGIVPADCKRAMTRLKESGRMPEARAAVLAKAEKFLASRRERCRLDCCWALEEAAAWWLAANGDSTAENVENAKEAA